MRRLRYVPHNGASPTKDNPMPGMRAFLLSDQVRDPAVKAAHDIAATAAELTPRSRTEGPHMADHYKVNADTPAVAVGKRRNRRVGAEVYNDVQREGEAQSHAAAAEFGRGFDHGQNEHARGHRALGRAGAVHGQLVRNPE